jgi:hypothetical protein
MKRFAVPGFMMMLFMLSLFMPLSMKAADKLPSIDDVIAQYTKALGNLDAMEKRWVLDLRGTCDSSAAEESGPIEVLVQGSKFFMQLNGGALLMGVNQDVFWRHPRGQEIVTVPASVIAETVAIFDPSRVLHWKERFPQIAVTGIQNVDDHDVYVIETKPGDPATERLFVDRRSGLLVRDEILAKHELFTFADFRAVDGIEVPFTIHQTTPGPSYAYHFSVVKHLTDVDETMFQPK